MSELKIVIFGAGSIGCYLGGLLVSSGQAVRFIGRARYQKALKDGGLKLSHFEREPIFISPEQIDFETRDDRLAGADIILLCTKSQDTEMAAAQIKAHADPDCLVISFQNGVRNAQTLRQVLPAQNVLAGIVPFNVTPMMEPGKAGIFHCGTAGDLMIEASHDVRLARLKLAFEASMQGVKLSENIEGDQWAKMIVNLNNGLNTLSGGPLKAGLLQRDYRRALALLVEEALSVAAANQVSIGTFNGRSPHALLKTLRLPNLAYRLVMQLIVKIDAKARSSMLDDLEAGRACEIEYLQGEIVRRAAKVNMDAPYNAAILAAVNQAFQAGRSPQYSGAQILSLLQS